MDTHSHHSEYMGLLISCNFFYLGSILTLIYVASKVKEYNERTHRRMWNLNHGEKKESDRLFYAHFVFLQLAMLLKLLTVLYFLGFTLGLYSHLSVALLKIVYNTSVVYLYIACSLDLYKWMNIVIRVEFFGGKLDQSTYVSRTRLTRINFIILSVVVPLLNLILIIVDATSNNSSKGVVSITVLCVWFFLLVSFIVTGSMLVRRLWVYFGENYKNQRPSLITKLLLGIASLACLNARYLVEFLYCK